MGVTAFPWDGESYPANTFDDLIALSRTDGVLIGASGSNLVVSGTSSPVAVEAGNAIVNGKLVKNSAGLTIAVPTPASSTRIDRIVIRLTYATPEATIVRLAGIEGGSAPALTQTDGTTWEYSLAQVSITTGGAITVTMEAQESMPRGQHVIGDLKFWNGVLTGHYPKHPILLSADRRWHLCNGDTENSYATPNLADRMLMVAGGTYANDATGGAATKNLAHTHAVGTLAAQNESAHTHGVGTLADKAAQAGNHNHSIGVDGIHTHMVVAGSYLANGGDYGATVGLEGNHDHGALTGSSNPNAHQHGLEGASAAGSAHTHALSGASASAGSASQDILPPYAAKYLLVFVGYQEAA